MEFDSRENPGGREASLAASGWLSRRTRGPKLRVVCNERLASPDGGTSCLVVFLPLGAAGIEWFRGNASAVESGYWAAE